MLLPPLLHAWPLPCASRSYTKGSPEAVLDMCSSVQLADSSLRPITEEARRLLGGGGEEPGGEGSGEDDPSFLCCSLLQLRFNLVEAVEAMARKGLRTLALAYRRLPPAGLPSAPYHGAALAPGSKSSRRSSATAAASAAATIASWAVVDLSAAVAKGEAERDMTLIAIFGLQASGGGEGRHDAHRHLRAAGEWGRGGET